MERDYPEGRVQEVLGHLEVRAEDSDDKNGVVVGRAVPYEESIAVRGEYLEVMDEQSFARSVERGAMKAPLLLHHNHDRMPIGKPLAWESRDDGLYGKWQIDLKSEAGAEAFRMASEGYIRGLSVGFTPDVKADQVTTDDDGVTTIRRRNAMLRECSLVSVPAYSGAQVVLTRSAGVSPRRTGPVDPRIDVYRSKFAELARVGR